MNEEHIYHHKRFTIVEAIIIAIVLGFLAFIGLKYTGKQPVSQTHLPPVKPAVASQPAVQPISNAAGLDGAITALDQNDPTAQSAADAAQLNAQITGW